MGLEDIRIKEEGLVAWFKEQLLPELVQKGNFSEEHRNSRIEKCEFEITERGTDHFASCPYFVTIVLGSESKRSEYHLVIKFTSQDPNFRDIMKTDGQFYNEMLMYNFVLPRFRDSLSRTKCASLMDQVCPVSYFAQFEKATPEKALIILEDLRNSGFKAAESKVELDLDHCTVALRQLAKFHAVSLAMKECAPSDLEQVKTCYSEVRYGVDEDAIEWNNTIFTRCNERGFDYLQSKEFNEVPLKYLEALREKVTNDPDGLMADLVRPREPLAVICHGDFCRNNILFRYENGRAEDARLFDFQTFRYSSPSVDLAFFIYMNTTFELREKHLDNLLRVYHVTLTQTVADILNRPHQEVLHKYPWSLIEKDFARMAVYGYVIAALFLPMMMAPGENASDLEAEVANKSTTELAEELYVQGGEVVSQRIAEIIIEFYRRKFYCSPETAPASQLMRSELAQPSQVR